MDRVLSHGPAPTSVTEAPEQDAMTLEAVELEFALGAIDVLTEGFDAALAKAAERVGGEVLFNIPALDTSEAQRIGAIAISGQPQDQVIFVTLRNDGTTLSLAPLTGTRSSCQHRCPEKTGNGEIEHFQQKCVAVLRRIMRPVKVCIFEPKV
ncbi:hypothetical protein ACT5RU_03280 [Brucella amazoniensis]